MFWPWHTGKSNLFRTSCGIIISNLWSQLQWDMTCHDPVTICTMSSGIYKHSPRLTSDFAWVLYWISLFFGGHGAMVLQASPKLAVNLVSRQVVQSRKTGAHEQALVMGRDFVYGNSDLQKRRGWWNPTKILLKYGGKTLASIFWVAPIGHKDRRLTGSFSILVIKI